MDDQCFYQDVQYFLVKNQELSKSEKLAHFKRKKGMK